jgi:hypothetical protein
MYLCYSQKGSELIVHMPLQSNFRAVTSAGVFLFVHYLHLVPSVQLTLRCVRTYDANGTINIASAKPRDQPVVNLSHYIYGQARGI